MSFPSLRASFSSASTVKRSGNNNEADEGETTPTSPPNTPGRGLARKVVNAVRRNTLRGSEAPSLIISTPHDNNDDPEFTIENPLASPLLSPCPETSALVMDDSGEIQVVPPTPLHHRVSQASILRSANSQSTLVRPGNSPLHKPASDQEKRQSLSGYMKKTPQLGSRHTLIKKTTSYNLLHHTSSISSQDFDLLHQFRLDGNEDDYDDAEDFSDNCSEFSDFYEQVRPMTGSMNMTPHGSFQGGTRNRMSSSFTVGAYDPAIVVESGADHYLLEMVAEEGTTTAYLHLRHFTPEYNSCELVLHAQLWSELGDRLGTKKVELRNMNKAGEIGRFHMMGEITLQLPIKVGYIQIRRKYKRSVASSRRSVDVFLHDVYLKLNADRAPNRDVLAYGKYQGYVNRKSDVLVRNVLSYNVSPHALKRIRDHPKNQTRHLQDCLMPDLEYAKVDNKPKSTNFLLTAHERMHQISNVLVEWPKTEANGKPHLFNRTLNVGFDPTKYRGVPGYAEFPNKNLTFGWLKFNDFYIANFAVDTLEYANKAAKSLPGRGLCYVDFTPFLLTRPPTQRNDREIADFQNIVRNFDTDEEFARQYLEGLFCTQLCMYRSQEEATKQRLAAAAAARTAPTPAASVNLIRQDYTASPAWVLALATECGADLSRPLFFVDYSNMVGLPRNKMQNGYFAPARCVMQVNAQKQCLVPIGIALYYEDDKQWKTHLPSHATWKVAKLFVKCAAGQEHQMVSHALDTHLCVEPFAVSLERKVPMHHILYRVLKPHFRYTLDLNFKAKTLLLNENGRFDYIGAIAGLEAGHLQLIINSFREWTITRMCFPDDMKRRGFDVDPSDPDFPLPGFLFAKDAVAMWKILESYLTGVIFEAYSSDEQWQQDDIAMQYFAEVHREGFPNNSSFHPTTREELVHVLTGVIHTATVIHAAVNFPQFAHYGFVANSPLILMRAAPPPGEQCAVDTFLPTDQLALSAMQATWGLSRFTLQDERFMLGKSGHFFNLSLWNDKRYHTSCEKFQQRVETLEKHITKRPESVHGTRYMWLLPSVTPTSITT